MSNRKETDFWTCAGELLNRMCGGGVLCTCADLAGRDNLLTLGWGQIGPGYHGRPVVIIAVTPLRYSWRFLEEVPEFTLAIPSDQLAKAVSFCGSYSGRDGRKFEKAGLTPVPGLQVRSASILECPVNVECRIYEKIAPPHNLLTPEHRRRPVHEQHTIYFAEALGTYIWQD